MSTHYVLVGSGVAALSAGEAIREVDPAGRITLVSDEPHSFYSRPALAYLIDGSINEQQLWLRKAEEEHALRLKRVHGRAASLDTEAQELVLDDGRRIHFDRLLIATGAASIPPEFPGADLDGVVQLDGLDGARYMLQRSRPGLLRPARAVVVGGGSTALEIVEGLHAQRLDTHYFLRGDRFWARVLDPLESLVVENRLRAEGVVLHHHTEIARAEGRKGKLQAAVTQSGERIECDLLAVATGVRPRLDLARSGGLQTDRGLLTDEYLRTSAANVFAAGDVAQVLDPVTGTALMDTLWQSALLQGRAAGLTMAGIPSPYTRQVALNVTRLAGITTTIIGAVDGGDSDPDLLTLTRGQSERWHANPGDWTIRASRKSDRVRLLVGPHSLTGAVVMGDQTPAIPLTELIIGGVDLSPIRRRLEEHPDHAVTLMLDFHRSWQRNGHAHAH